MEKRLSGTKFFASELMTEEEFDFFENECLPEERIFIDKPEIGGWLIPPRLFLKYLKIAMKDIKTNPMPELTKVQQEWIDKFDDLGQRAYELVNDEYRKNKFKKQRNKKSRKDYMHNFYKNNRIKSNLTLLQEISDLKIKNNKLDNFISMKITSLESQLNKLNS